MVKLKGMTINILSVGLVILASLILYAFLNPLSQPHSSEYAKTEIYVMKNALDSSEAYLRASFDYAVYQALYDVARKGGFSDAQSQTGYANNLAPVISCQKTDKIIGDPEKIIGCIPGKYGCSDSDGKGAYINEGYQVGLMQFLLKNLNYDVTVDCKFGKGSLEKLKEFQKSKGLDESGFLDDATIGKLKESFAYDNCGDYFYGCTNSFSAIWSSDIPEDQFKSNIKNEIVKNMNSYTSNGYVFLDLPLIGLPQYKSDKITISEFGYGVKVSLKGDNVRISKKDEYEIISLESSSDMEKIYDINIMNTIRKAKVVYNDIISSGCNGVKDEAKTDNGFKIEIKVSNKKTTPACTASVKVSVTEENPKKLPVFNGTSVAFEPIAVVFMVNFGDATLTPMTITTAPSAPTKPVEVGKILTLGDMITAGYTNYIISSSLCKTFTRNRFGSDWQTSNMLTEIKSIDTSVYESVILLGGINDITSGLTPTQIEQNLKAIDDYLASKNKKAVFLTILPWRGYISWDATKQQYTESVNAWLKTQYSGRVIDTYTFMGEGTDTMKDEYLARTPSEVPYTDRLHPSYGYDNLAKYIVQNLPSVGLSCG